MIEEDEYLNMLQIMAAAEPVYKRWVQRHNLADERRYRDDLLIALKDFLILQMAALDEMQQFAY